MDVLIDFTINVGLHRMYTYSTKTIEKVHICRVAKGGEFH